MAEPMVVRCILLLYLLLTAAAATLIWKNAAAPDALKNAGIAVATALPLLVAALPYVTRERVSAAYSFVLMFDSHRGSIVTGELGTTYDSRYAMMFTNLGIIPDALNADTVQQVMDHKGLDIIEKGVVMAIAATFSRWWDMESSAHPGNPTGVLRRYRTVSKNPGNVVGVERLQQAFAYNNLIAEPGVLVGRGLVLPPGAQLEASKDEHSRSISLEDRFMRTVISIQPSMSIAAQQGVWGVLAPDPTDAFRYYTVTFDVSVTMTPGLLSSYSPEMNARRRWFTVLNESLAVFDWTNVDAAVERSLVRDALSKTQNGDLVEEPKVSSVADAHAPPQSSSRGK